MAELQGEKIDIIPWSPDPATFVVNALAPAEVAKVVMDEEQRRIEVVVPDDQLSLAIGRRGQNVRLASQLTGWDIDILTEAEESERRQEEFRTRSKMFIEALDVDDVIAHLSGDRGLHLGRGGGVRAARANWRGIEGFDEDMANELQQRARTFLKEQNERLEARRQELGVADEIAAIDGVTPALLVALGEKGVKSLDDLADLAADELIEMAAGQVKLEEAEAKAIIMAARAHWFAEEGAGAAPAALGGVSLGHRRISRRTTPIRPAAAADDDGRGVAPLHRHRRGAAEDGAHSLRRRSRRARSCPM